MRPSGPLSWVPPLSDRLCDIYDALLLDLDGTVYRGTEAIPGAAETIKTVRENRTVIRFVTNNASRSPHEVAGQLNELGIPTDPTEVCTSAQAAASVLADRLPPHTTVLVVGAEALADEVRQVGLTPTYEATPEVKAVVQGLSKQLGWRELSEAVLAIRAGALWVACNVDATLPTERGLLIGNGALVAAVSTATDQQPEVAGKPHRPLMDQAAQSAQAARPLVVGDRLDTDIAGAAAAELDALFVLSGVSTPLELLTSELRPRYIAADITAVTDRAQDLEIGEQPGWTLHKTRDMIKINGQGESLGLLRALCAAHPGGPDLRLEAENDTARAALTELKLGDRLA
jgi:HAD superfamily hydrolase (TIGR01450 family)